MKKLEFASHPANLGLVRTCVRQFLQEQGFPARQVDLMVLGVDEACTNIIRHAYHLAEDKLITLSLQTYSGGVRFRLRDYGDQAELVQGRSLDHVRPGGLGLHLIRHAFDQVDYQRKSRGTTLVLTKFKSNNGDSTQETRPQETHPQETHPQERRPEETRPRAAG